MAKKTACLSMCVCRKDRAAIIFLPKAACVSLPLSTRTEKDTTHFLCVTLGDLSLGGGALLTASAKVADFLSVAEVFLGERLPVPFLRRRPLIDSRFADFSSPASSGEEVSSSERVFLLLRESSSSDPFGWDFVDFLFEC